MTKRELDYKQNSNWYHQIQGQLHVTRRKRCLFAVWSGENKPLKTTIIEKDDRFWEEKMKDKILSFYTDWLLPEIVDSRRARGMPLRENECQLVKTTDTSSDDNKENEACRKTQLTSESTILSSTTVDNKGNDSCCRRKLAFEEM
ncbi:hypothetical protein EVAR_23983_1 [Eumeta japonica]|uniref:Uncharacterized protein n=1 Tax=Eumeta variegata TaxID=151549 RepID=A0A4C1V1C5_EUMVA|nr:hypothetical protein EVAR_23983_1 [Eumeta japonica]